MTEEPDYPRQCYDNIAGDNPGKAIDMPNTLPRRRKAAANVPFTQRPCRPATLALQPWPGKAREAAVGGRREGRMRKLLAFGIVCVLAAIFVWSANASASSELEQTVRERIQTCIGDAAVATDTIDNEPVLRQVFVSTIFDNDIGSVNSYVNAAIEHTERVLDGAQQQYPHLYDQYLSTALAAVYQMYMEEYIRYFIRHR